ncbi:hypothetical protein BS50DRAFT_562143 [Corynespora cassiicola Philippines]|uniref:C2H2-type domain-containing protein n=1 Tax=Corynespora cassiicola Philippines TaxID=1448308 RepID=A0A2T2N954_CORCC|nr:hypothetical protein BS50DRAFT_562143 [Corynespora cassiicola Philippines]
MAPHGTNRYAALDDNLENDSPVAAVTNTSSYNPFSNQVAKNDYLWEDVKPRGAHVKSKTPAIQNNNLAGALRPHAPGKPLNGNVAAFGQRKIPDSLSERHSSIDHENWCGVCRLKFPSKAALQTHVKNTPNHRHYCNLCKRVFKDRNGIKNHVDNSAGHDTFCNLCLSAFLDEWGLKNHFENNSGVGHEFVCMTCLLCFHTEDELKLHINTGEKHVVCRTCFRSFRNQEERDTHWKNTMKHKHCLQPGCEFDGPDEQALERHIRYHHFHCDGCKEIFPSQNKLNAHYLKCTFDMKCRNCGESFAGRVKLLAHLETCFHCRECDFRTNYKTDIENHMTHHAPTMIPCWGCKMPMHTASSLINHLESGRCAKMLEPSLLTRVLGQWWYSPLYMDIDIHVQLRSGRVDPKKVTEWMKDGVIPPFICRAKDCGKMFGHLSSLALHVENGSCSWDITRLGLDKLEKEMTNFWVHKGSASD